MLTGNLQESEYYYSYYLSGSAQFPLIHHFCPPGRQLIISARKALSEAPLRSGSNCEIRIKVGPETTEISAKEVRLQKDSSIEHPYLH